MRPTIQRDIEMERRPPGVEWWAVPRLIVVGHRTMNRIMGRLASCRAARSCFVASLLRPPPVGNRCISSASEQSMPVTSRVRCEEADALRKASEDGESEIASKISRKQLEEHTGTENKGSNFERNHFRNIPSSNGERLWPAGEGKLGLRKITPSGSKFRVAAAPFTGPLKSPVRWG